MPRRQFFLRGHLSILLASLLGLSPHSLWAQKSPPLEENPSANFDRPIQLAPVAEATAHLDSVSPILPEAPGSQTELRVKLFRFTCALINAQGALNLQQPTGTAELPGKAKYFAGSASRQWLTSVYGKVHYPTIQSADHLQYYGHHIPWAGPTILRVSHLANAHPHATSVFKLLKPQF